MAWRNVKLHYSEMDKTIVSQDILLQVKNRIGGRCASDTILFEFSKEISEKGRLNYLLKQDEKAFTKAFDYWRSKNVFSFEQLRNKIKIAQLSPVDCLSLAKELITVAEQQLRNSQEKASVLLNRCDILTAEISDDTK